jgi:mediator of RNA polymerase II transcription subunit 31
LVCWHNRQFVQSLSNPYYLHHLCIQKYFDDDAFVEWCKYLKYFSEPEYLPYLSYVWLLVLSLRKSLYVHRESNRLSRYPGPTLKALDLVQQEQFRKAILRPDVVEGLMNEWMGAVMPPKEPPKEWYSVEINAV